MQFSREFVNFFFFSIFCSLYSALFFPSYLFPPLFPPSYSPITALTLTLHPSLFFNPHEEEERVMVAAMEESQTQMESLDLETEFLLSKKQSVWPASSSSTVLDDPLLLLLLRLTWVTSNLLSTKQNPYSKPTKQPLNTKTLASTPSLIFRSHLSRRAALSSVTWYLSLPLPVCVYLFGC
jgi:hypothetical protein